LGEFLKNFFDFFVLFLVSYGLYEEIKSGFFPHKEGKTREEEEKKKERHE
jgi:hypothetical protein